MSCRSFTYPVYGLILPPTAEVAAAIYTTLLNAQWRMEIAPDVGVDPDTVSEDIAFEALYDRAIWAVDLCTAPYAAEHAPLDVAGFLYAMCDEDAWGTEFQHFVLAYPMKLASGTWDDAEAAFPGRRAAVDAALQQVRAQLQNAGVECPDPDAWLLQTYA